MQMAGLATLSLLRFALGVLLGALAAGLVFSICLTMPFAMAQDGWGGTAGDFADLLLLLPAATAGALPVMMMGACLLHLLRRGTSNRTAGSAIVLGFLLALALVILVTLDADTAFAEGWPALLALLLAGPVAALVFHLAACSDLGACPSQRRG